MRKTLITIFACLSLTHGAFPQADEISQLKEKIIALQNQGELGFHDFRLCSTINGFGSYVPLADEVVDRSGSLIVYYEPANIYTSIREGVYEIWYTQDMAILNEKGEMVNEWEDFLTFHYMAKKPVLDLFAQNSVEINNQLPPGKYRFKVVLNDKLRGKSVTKVIDFELR